MSTPIAGWYADPYDTDVQRWWTGHDWSHLTRLAPPVVPQPGGHRRRVDDRYARLAVTTMGMLGVVALWDVALISGNVYTRRVAPAFADGTISMAEAQTVDTVASVGTFGTLGLTVLAAILFIRWLHWSHSSDRMNRLSQEHGSGWAIGGWFVPILALWRPLGVVTDVRRGIQGPSESPTPLMWAWWVAFLASTVSNRVAGAGWSRAAETTIADLEDLAVYADRLANAADLSSVAAGFDLVAAVLAILLVRSCTRMVQAAPVVR